VGGSRERCARAGKPLAFFEHLDCDEELTIESCRLAFYSELKRFFEAEPTPWRGEAL
jgi:hypothetical protein